MWRIVRPILVALAIGAVAFAANGRILLPPHPLADFSVYWAAAGHAFGPVYDPGFISRTQDALGGTGWHPFAYPPTFLLLTLPVAALPYRWAFTLWTAVSTAAFVEAGARLEKRLWPLLALAPLSIQAWNMGQATVVVGALLFLGLAWRSRPIATGALFGLALCIKPQAVILAPLALIVWRQWRSLAAMSLVGAALVVISAVVFGPEKWLAWLGSLGGFNAIAKSIPKVTSIAPGWRMTGWAYLLVRGASTAAGLGLLWITRKGGDLERLLGLVGGSLLCSPYVVIYDAALLLPVAIAMLAGFTWRTVPALIMMSSVVIVPLPSALFLAFVASAAVRPRPAVRAVVTPTSSDRVS